MVVSERGSGEVAVEEGGEEGRRVEAAILNVSFPQEDDETILLTILPSPLLLSWLCFDGVCGGCECDSASGLPRDDFDDVVMSQFFSLLPEELLLLLLLVLLLLLLLLVLFLSLLLLLLPVVLTCSLSLLSPDIVKLLLPLPPTKHDGVIGILVLVLLLFALGPLPDCDDDDDDGSWGSFGGGGMGAFCAICA